MQLGVVFPQNEISADPADVRRYAETVEQLGYRHLLIYDHVLGADPAVHQGWSGPYDINSSFHEPFVLLGYVAALTSLELITGVIILPQRQTALVAKQAAEVDCLTGGRFRLGIGVGRNAVEYEALGKRFTDRGRRSEEQIALLRRLWTEPSVSFDGAYERVTGAGINPMPVQRPIPIWLGTSSPPGYRRTGRLADGWLPQVKPGPDLAQAQAIVRAAAADAGRDPDAIGMEGRISWAGDAGAVARELDEWRAAGATHVSINTMKAGLADLDAHLAVLADAARSAGL